MKLRNDQNIASELLNYREILKNVSYISSGSVEYFWRTFERKGLITKFSMLQRSNYAWNHLSANGFIATGKETNWNFHEVSRAAQRLSEFKSQFTLTIVVASINIGVAVSMLNLTNPITQLIQK